MHVVSKFKKWIFTLEALNSFAAGFYFNWIFFYTQKVLQFGIVENLMLVAMHGFIYTGAAWLGGWFGHRYGNFAALKIGFAIMGLVLLAGAFLPGGASQVSVIMGWTFGMCFTWPMLQSLICAGEPAKALPNLAGLYNLTWSGIAAISFFIGGTIVEKLGMKSVFILPAVIHAFQFAWVFSLEQTHSASKNLPVTPQTESKAAETTKRDPRQKLFLRLALLANPIAYVAINTVIPMMPEVAKRFELTPMCLGFVGATWFFVRAGAFVLFWLWPKWHYRFRWLIMACVALTISFLGILLSSNLLIVILAQVIFGVAAGLIYYSSLFYSLDGGNAESEHGGAHEAMIGLGTFVGASVGAAAKFFWPNVPGISIWAVSVVLLIGCATLIFTKTKSARPIA
ncbi:MAG: Major facilitator superfamily 1 [Verrucomicrobiales bacterium]|nr:Major facilitator superfamily 1 [Verrucomicrobiales bacterium]